MPKTTILATPENFSENERRKGKLAPKLSSDKESRVSHSFSFMLVYSKARRILPAVDEIHYSFFNWSEVFPRSHQNIDMIYAMS
jgi:hypothetical protein